MSDDMLWILLVRMVERVFAVGIGGIQSTSDSACSP